jgi:hypothetical protein
LESESKNRNLSVRFYDSHPEKLKNPRKEKLLNDDDKNQLKRAGERRL